MKKTFAVLVAIITAFVFSGCATSQKANSYTTGTVQQKMKVVLATVIDVREVDIEAQSSGAGAVPGALVGGVAGSNMGQGKGSLVGAITGAVVGGVVGTVADKGVNSKKGVEIVYQVDGAKEMLALVQELDDQGIKQGDRVRIMEGQFNVRAVKMAAVQQ